MSAGQPQRNRYFGLFFFFFFFPRPNPPTSDNGAGDPSTRRNLAFALIARSEGPLLSYAQPLAAKRLRTATASDPMRDGGRCQRPEMAQGGLRFFAGDNQTHHARRTAVLQQAGGSVCQRARSPPRQSAVGARCTKSGAPPR